jgi:hypothetical protein
MAMTSQDKVLLGSAALVVVASAIVFGGLAWRRSPESGVPVATVELAEAEYVATVQVIPPAKTRAWTAPAPQSRGREWLYDVFTPPEIFFNARTRQFTVRPPSSLVDEELEEAFGLDLIAVQPEPFRLQLIGYVGEEGNWRGMFENLLSREVLLAGAGHRLPNLALSIKNLEVRPHPIALAESMTTRQRVATAVVYDERAGHDVTITHRERHFTGTVSAFVAAAGQAATREVRAGESFKLGDATFTVERVQLSPPAIEVTRQSPHRSQPDRRVITPREADEVEAVEPGASS